MKNIIVIIALAFLPQHVRSESFQKYLSFINKAESYLVQDDYKRAQISYDFAFHTWGKPFAVDLFNALKCANLNRDYAKVRALAKRLVALGVEISFFENPEYLDSFRRSVEYGLLISEYPDIRLRYLQHNNWKLRTTVEQMLPVDQYLRRMNPVYTFLRDSIYKRDDTVKAKLVHLFKNKFPNEYDYGVFMQDDTTVVDWEPLHIVILHNYGKFDTTGGYHFNLSTYDFTPLLIDAVRKGDMHPEEFAMLNDRSGKFMMGHGYGQENMLTKIKNRLYYEKQGEKVIIEIEKNRSDIGICNREQGRQKLIYDAKSNVHKFILRRNAFGVVFFSGYEFPEKVVKNLFVDTGVTVDKSLCTVVFWYIPMCIS